MYVYRLSMVPRSDLQKALSTFLSLNPNVHLLPLTTLTHLTVLYAQVHNVIYKEYSCPYVNNDY